MFRAGGIDATRRVVAAAPAAGQTVAFDGGSAAQCAGPRGARAGQCRHAGLVDAEGAHRTALLATQMAHADAPEQAHAAQSLRRQGALDASSLPRTSVAIARMIRNFSL